MEAAAIIRKPIPEYKSRLQLLESISFKQVIGTKLPDIKVELSKTEGVVFIGTTADIDKAQQLLANVLSSLKTSNHLWKMDRYKVQLLYAKETQQFLRDEFVRQDIKCHFVFDEEKESVHLLAQSTHDIGKAQSALEKCVCVMKVEKNEPFCLSTATDLSLEHSGKFIQIDEEERSPVFVFTCDIEDDVKMGRHKALENVGMDKKEAKNVTEVTYSEYKSRVQMLKCLSFKETLRKEKLNVEVILDSENGVVCKGPMADIKKAQLVLNRFIEELKTSEPKWRLDSFKVQLLYVKEVQQFLQEEILRQGIKCYFTFQDTDESVKLFACSDADIRMAQSAIEQCVCVMEVPINDQFVLTEATDLSLEFAGKFIQIDEDDKAVFVFTSDIEADVRKARASANSTTDDRETRKLESSEKKSDASGTRTPESSEKKSVAAGTRTPESSEKSSKYSSDDTSRDNDDDDDEEEEEEEEEEEKDYGHDNPNQYVYFATSAPAGHTRIDPFVDMEDDHGASDKKEESESMAHIISRELYMDVSLAEYLFNVRQADIQQFENKYGLTIGLDCGVVQLLGEGESDQKFDEAIAALEKLASSISMGSMYFNGYSAVDYFTSEKFDSYRERLTGNNRDLVIGPVLMNVGENALATTVVFNDIEVKITDEQMTDLKTVEVMVCPLNSSLVATSSVAEQVLLQGGSILQKRCASAVTKYTSTHGGKPSVGCVFYIDEVGQLSRKLLCAIVVEDWYSNKRDLMKELEVSISRILEFSNKKGFTSIAIPLDIGEKVPALEFGRLCCYAIQNHRKSKKRLQSIHLCVTERRTIHKVLSVVRNTLGLVTEEEVMPVNKAHFQNAADRVRGFKETTPYSKRMMVEVVTESLVEQRVDAIVAVVGQSLVLNNGAVTRSIITAGGQEIQDEIKKEYPYGIGPCEVIKSSPGNLPCRLILFGCLPAQHDGYDIEKCLKLFMRNCFELVKKHRIRSLAFPAIATGNLAYPRDMVAREMFRSVYMYAESCAVRNVKFVLHNKDKVGMQVFKGFKHVYKTELSRITKDLSKARQKIDVKIGEWKGAIEIVKEICESDLSDIIIVHGRPKKTENTDTCLGVRTVRVRKSETTRFTREVLFVEVEANTEIESIVVEAYRGALKYAVATRNAQLVTIDLRECQTYGIVSTVSEILNILAVVLDKASIVEKVQILVEAIPMQDLLINAHTQESKAKKTTGMLGTWIPAAVIPKFLAKTPIFWNVVTERGYDNMAGVRVTVIATNDKAIQKAISGFSSEIAKLQDGVSDSAKDSSEISEESDNSPDDTTNNKDDLKPAEIYGKLSLRVSSKVTSRFPKNKLSEITDGINQLDEISAELTEGNINITTEYSKKSVVKQIFNNVFEDPTREPDQGPYYIQCVEQRIYNLLELDLKEDGKELDRKIKYNHLSFELCVNGNRDTYMFISGRINTLIAYTSDSIETTNVEQRHKINKSIDDVKGDFPELIVDVTESEIHIHGPSEVVQKAKHKLKVLLGLVKTTGRRRRSIADEAPGAYSSLQPSVSEKSVVPGTELRSQYQSMRETNRSNNDDSNHRDSNRRRKGSANPVTFSTTERLTIKVYKGSITNLKVDCIVNAANESLAHAGGVAYVIARAAGRQFENECEEYVSTKGKLKVTECVATGPGNLKYANIIHAVGPRWNMYTDKDACGEDLSLTVLNCLVKADKLRMRSVAIPSISAGIFGMPKETCAAQYGRGVYNFSSSGRYEHLKEVHFVDIDDEIIHCIQSVFSNVFIVLPANDVRSEQENTERDHIDTLDRQEKSESEKGNGTSSEHCANREFKKSSMLYKPQIDVQMDRPTQLKGQLPLNVNDPEYPKSDSTMTGRCGSSKLSQDSFHTQPQAKSVYRREASQNDGPGNREIRNMNEDLTKPSQGQAPKRTTSWDESRTFQNPDASSKYVVSTAQASSRATALPIDAQIPTLSVHGNRRNPHKFYPLKTDRVCIQVYRQDISVLKVDAVVSIEDEFCQGGGNIAQAINKVCGPAYAAKHRRMRSANLKLTSAYVTTSGAGAPFKYVIHTIAPRWNKHTTAKNLNQFKGQLKKSIGNILQITKTKADIGTIGIPLLGIGDESTELDKCCGAFIDGIMELCGDGKALPQHLTQIHLIGLDGGVVFALKELITAFLDGNSKPTVTDQSEWTTVPEKKKSNKNKHANQSKRKTSYQGYLV